jgi:ubiquinone/menaquinone biosynthesis C-methylase UbiE
VAKSPDSVRRFFGEHSDSWLRRYYSGDFDSVNYQDRMHEALRLLEACGEPAMRVLDLGCGAGVQAGALQALGHEVYACDIAFEMAQKARDRIGPSALVAVGEKLPFADESFDAVVALGVIGYSADPQAFLNSLQRVLRPGGLLIISSANERLLLERISGAVSYWPNRCYRWAKARITGRPLPAADTSPGFYLSHYNYMDARRFDQLLAGSGFQRVAGSGVNFGRLHFMGKLLPGEGTAIALSRALTRLSRRIEPLQRHSRIYVTALRKPLAACENRRDVDPRRGRSESAMPPPVLEG